MDQQHATEVLRNLDQRTKRMEQILPDLPTRAEVREAIDTSIKAAVAPLATREEMHEAIQTAVAPLATREEMHEAIQAAVAPLATKAELRQGLADLRDELRRHMDVWAEQIGGTAKLAFEGIEMVDEKHGRSYEEVRQRLLDLIRTEAQHHVGCTRSYEELRQRMLDLVKTESQHHAHVSKTLEEHVQYWREYINTHARAHAETSKAIEKVRGRVEKIEAKQPRKRKAS